MRRSTKDGRPLPENEAEYLGLVTKRSSHLFTSCLLCKNDFSEANTHSARGWAETQITSVCEDCFDGLTSEKPLATRQGSTS